MDQKYKEYRKFDWTLSDKWQNYLNNIFPTPSRELLEKIRRKWYKSNVDSEFDVSYQPPADGAEETRQQPDRKQAYEQFMRQQQQQNQSNVPDALPSLRMQQMILWVVFYLSLPLRLYTNWIVVIALVIGVVKRYGIPKFNKEYLQRIMFDDNLQMLPYLGVVAVAAGGNLILYMPLCLHGFLEIAPLFNNLLQTKPNLPIISSAFFKGYIKKGVENRSQFVEMKADMEVYIGLYLIVVWFLGWSSLLSIMMYWQIMRLRYMINANSKAAFARVNAKINNILAKPFIPGIVRTLYQKISGFISSMADSEMNQAQGGAGVGGMFSKCSIF